MSVTTLPRSDLDRTRFFIDGAWVEPLERQTYSVIEAGTGEPMATAAVGSAADIDAAVRAARVALNQGPWGRSTPAERAAAMRRFAAALAERADTTSWLCSRENGSPRTLSDAFNGAGPSAMLNMYADMIEQFPFEEARPSPAGATLVRREPVGVVGAIPAWNGPQMQSMMKIAPALATGCTVVLKVPTETPLDPFVFGDAAAEAELPPGVLNIVVADREVGNTLITHPLVDKIAFTGSTAAGRRIAAECGRLIRRCTLELGGKSAAIVLDDADLDVLRAGLYGAALMNNGQNCTAQSRILAPRSRYEDVVEAVAAAANDLVVGDPLDTETTCGPMASELHMNRVLGMIEAARGGGARLVTGGGRPAGQDRGWFVEPTVFADVDNDDGIAREEVFGPVLAVIPYDDDEDALNLANDSEFGLAGSVWTRDEQRGLDLARRVRTGTIGVNRYDIAANAPFGGMKASGIGRENGPEALNGYIEYKSVAVSAEHLNI